MGLFTTKIIERNNTSTYVPYEKTVHEHKAPTDESIKMLQEMKEKTISSIISQSCGNNILEGFIFQVEDDVLTTNKIIYGGFKLNGELYEFNEKTSSVLSKGEMLKKLMEEISVSIFMQIQKKIVEKVITISYH